MEKMRGHARKINKRRLSDKPVIKKELKWLDFEDILTKVVTPLRQECNYRTFDGTLRSDTAIASSFQAFLTWGLLTFCAPRRQQEFQNLKIATSCPIQKPLGLKSNQIIHPLPSNRLDKIERYHGYLFKDFDGSWYTDMTSESYKTGKTYGHQKLLIPNELFGDGKTFYDYLEAFLYGYYRDCEGNWVSGGASSNTFVGKSKYIGLRTAFNPKHNHIFSLKSGGVVSEAAFGEKFAQSAHRLTGKMTTPHLLRSIFATHFLDQGYSQDLINSLAYGMGHSPDELRKEYDRRRPQQKHRPIEETIAGLIQQFVA